MKRGGTYQGLEQGLRMVIKAAMNYYEVDATNNRFIEILDRIVKDVKEGKQI